MNALYSKRTTFIRWPTLEESERNIETIRRSYGFPGVIGAIDGTCIKLIVLKDNKDSYINRKGFYSIKLQVGEVDIYRYYIICIIYT